MLVVLLMSHASVDLFVLSFVLPFAYAYVASENQGLLLIPNVYKILCFCGLLIRSIQCCQITTISYC